MQGMEKLFPQVAFQSNFPDLTGMKSNFDQSRLMCADELHSTNHHGANMATFLALPSS